MSDKTTYLRDCVITIASDDYENFELILEQTKNLAASRGVVTDDVEVAEIVKRLIADGLLEAYELSVQPAYSKKVDYVPEQLHELWYYVTPRGKALAKSILALSGESPETT